ncbi:hypothetical protein E2320_013376 [Naja naja]|nr:hypothetical protein E2320_013376 [Naja naja]
MVRTKANCGGTSGAYRKVVAARAPRKALGSGQANISSSPTSRKKYVLCLLVLQNRKNLKMIKCELILDLQADLVLPEHCV